MEAEESIEDLMRRATWLAFAVLYGDSDDETLRADLPLLDKGVVDEAYTWADGLPQQYVDDRLQGRCSLASFLDFDLGKVEQRALRACEAFQKIVDGRKT